mmetsp:Transcript_12941/g.40860  ORF Transcript_12941/g.40860 Transcript_12941/m.40860 type:complete len:202 (+) Transcript_12941:253-858(+)
MHVKAPLTALVDVLAHVTNRLGHGQRVNRRQVRVGQIATSIDGILVLSVIILRKACLCINVEHEVRRGLLAKRNRCWRLGRNKKCVRPKWVRTHRTQLPRQVVQLGPVEGGPRQRNQRRKHLLPRKLCNELLLPPKGRLVHLRNQLGGPGAVAHDKGEATHGHRAYRVHPWHLKIEADVNYSRQGPLAALGADANVSDVRQ